jgi:hypothetical protein
MGSLSRVSLDFVYELFAMTVKSCHCERSVAIYGSPRRCAPRDDGRRRFDTCDDGRRRFDHAMTAEGGCELAMAENFFHCDVGGDDKKLSLRAQRGNLWIATSLHSSR